MNNFSVPSNDEHSFADDHVSRDEIAKLQELVENRCAEITARLDAVLDRINTVDLFEGDILAAEDAMNRIKREAGE